MRKRLSIIFIVALFVLAACSGATGAFQKEMKKVQELMNDMKYEEALDLLVKLEEDLEGDPYEVGRRNIVEDYKSDAQYMLNHLESLTNQYEEAMAKYEETMSMEEPTASDYSDALYSLNNAMNAFGGLDHLDMFQDLNKAITEITDAVDTKLVQPLVAKLEEDLQAEEFGQLDAYLDELYSVTDYFSDIFSYDDYQALSDKVEAAKARYIALPHTINKWESPIYKKDYGNIQIIGYQDFEDYVKFYVAFDGVYAHVGDKVDLDLQFLLSDGEIMNGRTNDSPLFYPDKYVRIYQVNLGEREISDIVRINVDLPLAGDEPIVKKIDSFEPQGELKIAGIESQAKTLTPNQTVNTDQFDIEIKEIEIGSNTISFSGNIIPKDDITISTASFAYLPFSKVDSLTNYSWGRENTENYYEGTTVEFHISHAFRKDISEEDKYVQVRLFEQLLYVDLNTGQLINAPSPVSLLSVYIENSDDFYKYFDSNSQRDLINLNGQYIPNGLVFPSNGKTKVYLDGKYKTLKTKAHFSFFGANLESEHTVVVTFYSVNGDEKTELQTVEFTNQNNLKDIQVNLSGVDVLEIEVDSSFYFSRDHRIIFENPMLE